MPSSSLSFMSPTPLPDRSSGATTTPTITPQAAQPPPPTNNNLPGQYLATAAPLAVPSSTTSVISKPKVPSVITSKPAAQQAQKQIADVNAKLQEVEKQQKANISNLTTPGAGYVSSDQAIRDRVKAMSDEASLNAYNAKVASISGTQTQNAASSGTQTQNAASAGTGDQFNKDAKNENTVLSNENTVKTPSYTKTPEDLFVESLKAIDNESKAALDDFVSKQNQIMNGSYPLSPSQQAQLDAIRLQYENLIQQQKSINTSYQNALKMAGISAGRNMYAPEIELGNINEAVTAGAMKIAELNSSMLSALAEARSAIQQDNMKALDQAYKNINDNLARRRQSIEEIYNVTTKEIQRSKDDYEKMKEDIEAMAEIGKSPENFSPGFFDKIDAQREKLGLPTYQGYSYDIYKLQYNLMKKKREQQDTKTQFENAVNFISIMDKLGTKGEITIGDHTYSYQGTNQADYASGTETDNKTGKLMAWRLNKKTGEVKVYDLGINMKTGDKQIVDVGGLKYAFDKTTGEATPIWISDSRQSWEETYPTGSVGPALPGSEAGQCGAMNNYFYGKRVVGSTLQSKLEPLSKYAINYSVNNISNIREGMTFVQNIGTYGHVGFVESKGIDKFNNKGYITVFESNYHGDGKINHGRKIYLDDPTLKMISDYPAPRLPGSGPDTSRRVQLGDTSAWTQTDVANPDSSDILSQTGLSMLEFDYLTKKGAALTRLSESTREQIINSAENWARSHGIDVSTFPAQYKAYNDALQASIKRQNMTKIMENELRATLDNLDQAAREAGLGKINYVNMAKIMAGGNFNDPAMQKYKVHINQLISEMAGFNAAAQGKDSPDLAQLEEARKVIKDGFAVGGIHGMKEAVEATTEKMKTTMQYNVDDARRQVWDLFGVGQNYKSTIQKQAETNSPEIPSNFSEVVENERKKGTKDDMILNYFLEYKPEYTALVNKAKKNGKTSTDILNALMK